MMKTVQLVAGVVGVAVLVVLGGSMSAEAQSYFNIVVEIQEYEVVEYNDFNLVRMKLLVENLDTVNIHPTNFGLTLGGDINVEYNHVAYADVRGKGGDVSVNDCAAKGRTWIDSGETAEITSCFMIGKSFEPDGLRIWVTHKAQVIPFHEESTYCFVQWSGNCNANNIQNVDGTPEPSPAPVSEPEPEPEPATLVYALYNNHTGTLTLVFDQLVVAHNPDRVSLIHDIEAFIENGEAPGLGNAELYTVDNKRQSAVLAFKLPDVMRLEVMESLQTHGDLALMIDTRAIYAAEGFVDITRPDSSPMLVLDIKVLR